MNEPTDLDEDRLDAVVPVPVGEDGQLARFDLAVRLRDEGEVDARDELDRGRTVGVIFIAVYLERIDPVLVHRLDHFIFIVFRFEFSMLSCAMCGRAWVVIEGVGGGKWVYFSSFSVLDVFFI